MTENEKKIFFRIIKKIGYQKIKKSDKNNQKILIKVFQRRFRQSLVNGIIDKECLIIGKNLIKIVNNKC